MNKLLNLENKYLQSQQIVDWGYTELSTPITYDYYDQWVKKDLHGGLNI
jgi:hypothetical protein